MRTNKHIQGDTSAQAQEYLLAKALFHLREHVAELLCRGFIAGLLRKVQDLMLRLFQLLPGGEMTRQYMLRSGSAEEAWQVGIKPVASCTSIAAQVQAGVAQKDQLFCLMPA